MSATLLPARTDQLPGARTLAGFMDSAFRIPGTRLRFGLDSLLGLFPGVGDAVSALIGSYVILIAANANVPRLVIWRMTANLLVDTAVGAIPFVGDLFDLGWKANTRNVALLEQALADPAAARRGSFWVLAGMMVVVLAVVAAGVALTWWAVRLIAG